MSNWSTNKNSNSKYGSNSKGYKTKSHESKEVKHNGDEKHHFSHREDHGKHNKHDEHVKHDKHDNCATVSVEGGGRVPEGECAEFSLHVNKESRFDISAKLCLEGAGKHPADANDFEGTFFTYNESCHEFVPVEHNRVIIPRGEDSVKFFVKTSPDCSIECTEGFKVVLKDVRYIEEADCKDHHLKIGKDCAEGWIVDNDFATVDVEGGGKVCEGECAEFKLHVDKLSNFDIKATLCLEGKGKHPASENDFDGTFFTFDEHCHKFVPVECNTIIIPKDQHCVKFYVKTHHDCFVECTEGFAVTLKNVEYVMDGCCDCEIQSPKIGESCAEGCIVDRGHATVDIDGGGRVCEGECAEFKLNVDKLSDFDIKATLCLVGKGKHPASENDFDGKFFTFDESTHQFVPVEGNTIIIPHDEHCVKFFVKTQHDCFIECTEGFAVELKEVEYVMHDDCDCEINCPKIGEHCAKGWIVDHEHATVDVEGCGIVFAGECAEFKLHVDKLSDFDIKAKLCLVGKGKHPAGSDDFQGTFYTYDESCNKFVPVECNTIIIPHDEHCVKFYVKTNHECFIECTEGFAVELKEVEYVMHEGCDCEISCPKIGEHCVEGWIIDPEHATVDVVGGGKVCEGECAEFKLHVDKLSDFDIKAKLCLVGKGSHPADADDFEGTFYTYDESCHKFVPVECNTIIIPHDEHCVKFFVKTKHDCFVECTEGFAVILKEVEYVKHDDCDCEINCPKIGEHCAQGWIVNNEHATVDVEGCGRVIAGECAEFKLNVDKLSEFDIKATLCLEGRGKHPADADDFDGTFYTYDESCHKFVPVECNTIIIPHDEHCVKFFVKTNHECFVECTEGYAVVLKDVQYVMDCCDCEICPPRIGEHCVEGCIIDNEHATVDVRGGGKVCEGECAEFSLKVDKLSELDIKAKLCLKGTGNHPADACDFEGTFYTFDESCHKFVPLECDSIIIPHGQECVKFYVKTAEDCHRECNEGFKVVLEEVKYVGEDACGCEICPPEIGICAAEGYIKGNECFHIKLCDSECDSLCHGDLFKDECRSDCDRDYHHIAYRPLSYDHNCCHEEVCCNG